MSRPRRVGLPWYGAENYEALRRELADGASLPPLYETWRIATEQMEREVVRSGIEVIRVPIDLASFTVWCAQNDRQSDGSARAQYAAAMLVG